MVLIIIWSIVLFCANLRALQSVQYDFERLSEPAQKTYFNEVSNTHWIVTIVVSRKLKAYDLLITSFHEFQILNSKFSRVFFSQSYLVIFWVSLHQNYVANWLVICEYWEFWIGNFS